MGRGFPRGRYRFFFRAAFAGLRAAAFGFARAGLAALLAGPFLGRATARLTVFGAFFAPFFGLEAGLEDLPAPLTSLAASFERAAVGFLQR